jgi:hypothetical protein
VCEGLQCLSSVISPQRQRYWASMRLYSYIIENNVNIPSFFKDFSKMLQVFSLKTFVESKNPKQYFYHVKKYFEYSVKEKGNLEVLFERFSKSKMYERETYRSVGAFLHIVMKNSSLHQTFYQDSLLDNFGFCLENMGNKKSKWTQEQRERTCKYINRMCNASLLIERFKRIEELEELTGKINHNRKIMRSNDALLRKLYAFLNYKNTESKAKFIQCLFEEFKHYLSNLSDF